MSNERSALSVISLAGKENVVDALGWLGYSLVGSLVPLWGQVFVLPLFSQEFHLFDLVRHGEFILYSAAFLAPAIYLVVKDFRKSAFPSRLWFLLLAGFGLLVSALVYGGLLTAERFAGTEGITIVTNENYLLGVSFVVFPFSVGFGFLVVLLDNLRIEYDLHGETVRKRNLAEQVEALGTDNE